MTHPLAALGSATVHEASGGRGALPCDIAPAHPGARVAGRAFTVDCPGGDNFWLHRALYAAAPGDVLVAAVRPAPAAGYWGEVMACAALARGLAGLVIDGCVRDIDRITELGFPVFATGRCIRGTTKCARDGALGGRLRFGDTEVDAGDLVIGDADGVVVVAAADIESVSAAAHRRAQREAQMLERIARGETTLGLLGIADPHGPSAGSSHES